MKRELMKGNSISRIRTDTQKQEEALQRRFNAVLGKGFAKELHHNELNAQRNTISVAQVPPH